MRVKYSRLGDELVARGMITTKQLEEALVIQKKENRKIGEILITMGYINDDQLMGILEEQMGINHIDLKKVTINRDIPSLIGEKMARRHYIIPFAIEGNLLKLAMVDPLNIIAIKDVKLATSMEVEPYIATFKEITAAIDQYYNTVVSSDVYDAMANEFDFKDIEMIDEELLAEINNAPAVKMVNNIIEVAVKLRASDIHIEPYENELRVRYRVDGELSEGSKPPKLFHSAIVTRIKIMATLNIAERRIPQDGRVEIEINNRIVDLRVSILPTIYGEKIVIRILDRSANVMSKKELGFSHENLENFDKIIRSPYGIFLVTGPTGSGKTTTLYAALTELNDESKNIITVEDPVEYRMRGVNQTQVNVKAGLTFASGLRSILRQDPDIIMIGEIRDAETAQIAVRAAITGHLVLSTVHTNDTASTIARMVDMGIEPFLLSSSLVGILAQRLVKKICTNCKESYPVGLDEALLLGIEEGTLLHRGTGCNYCNNTGYKGRTAIHEILPVTRTIKVHIDKEENADVIKRTAMNEGMKTLRDSARELVLSGVTTVDELLRLTYSID
ncbi:MAG: Flp pilus assembly complex ATPase component TadA [Clostridiales bacterium]|nr:Flp pilus assembly complex ATPase component TadA [Clostridiales bacterium]